MTRTDEPAPTESNRSLLRSIARRAMVKRGLLAEFSPAAVAEAARIARPALGGGPDVRDLRGLLWASIDNDHSRDLDQLSVAEPLQDGAAKILVAIADVDGTVHPGSAIDAHARANTTSVYTAAAIFPMVPEKLSTDLTSLGEEQDRSAVVTEMVIEADGTLREERSRIYRALSRTS